MKSIDVTLQRTYLKKTTKRNIVRLQLSSPIFLEQDRFKRPILIVKQKPDSHQ